MAKSEHTVVIETEEATLWSFLQEKGEWATLIPGYLHHEFPSKDEMIWVFKGDFGFIEKAVKVLLKETAVDANKKIAFSLEGLSDNINGHGSFEMEPLADGQYKLVGTLDLAAGGFLGGMINPVLEKFVPATTTDLVDAMGKAVKQLA